MNEVVKRPGPSFGKEKDGVREQVPASKVEKGSLDEWVNTGVPAGKAEAAKPAKPAKAKK